MISQEQYEHLIKLLEENNEMLKKVVAFVDKRNDPDYIAEQQVLEFLNNVTADILVDMLSPAQRKKLQEIVRGAGNTNGRSPAD